MWSSRRNRLLLSAAVVVMTAAAVVPSPVQAAQFQTPAAFCQGGLGIALLEIPAVAQDDPRARTYIVDHVSAGARLTRKVRVCNGTSEALAVQLYAGAATVEDGAFRAVEGRAGNELSQWVTVSPPRVTVPPKGEIVATAVIDVPPDAEPGERYAVVLAEKPAVQQPSGYAVAGRVGVRIYLSVGGDAEPTSDFLIDSLQAVRRSDGSPGILASVKNTGDRALDLRGDLRLTDGPGGLSGGPFPAELGTTLGIGQSAPVSIALDDAIRGGPWTATLTLRSGLLERVARGQITFPDEAGAEAEPVAAENLSPREDPKILVPLAGSLIALIALLLLLWWWLLARRRTKDDEEDEQEQLVPTG